MNHEFAKATETFVSEICTTLSSKGIKAKGIIAMGDARTLIDQQIVKSNADLVIMARSRKGSIRSFFLGSVSNHVLHSSSVPVIILP